MYISEQWAYALPSREGVPPEAIRAMVEEWDRRNLGVHSMMLLRHDRVIAESWWAPYRRDEPHMLNSLTKSFTSTAIGFAVQDGLLTVEDPVVSFFPEKAALADEHMKEMRVKHLLTMSTGHEPANADFIFHYADPVQAFLESEVAKAPGSRFVYNTGATYMLSAIISRVTGKSALDYLQEKLFDPLDIHGITWEHCPQGNALGGVGLSVKTDDIAKLGLFLLHEGNWRGRQLLNAEWVRTATAKHISNDASTQTPWLDSADEESGAKSTAAPTDWNQGYGYQFWRCVPKHVYRGDGAFGQYCIVMPDQNAVMAITSGCSDMQAVLNVIWNTLLPAMSDSPLPDEPAAQEALEQTLTSRRIAPPVPQAVPGTLPGTRYQMAENGAGIAEIEFAFGDRRDTLIFRTANGEFCVPAGHGKWAVQHLNVQTPRTFPFQPDTPYGDIACAGAWTAANVYELKMVCTRSAYVRTLRFTFVGGRLTLEYYQNVACAPEGITLHGFLR